MLSLSPSLRDQRIRRLLIDWSWVSESQGQRSNDGCLSVGLEGRGVCCCRRGYLRWCRVDVSCLWGRRRRRYQRIASESPGIVSSVHRLQPRLQIQRQGRVEERVMEASRKSLLLRMLGRRKWNRQLNRGNERIFPCRMMMMRVVKMTTDNWRGRFHWMVMMIVVGASWIVIIVVATVVVVTVRAVVWQSSVVVMRSVRLAAPWRRLRQRFRLSTRTVFVVGMLLHVQSSGNCRKEKLLLEWKILERLERVSLLLEQ